MKFLFEKVGDGKLPVRGTSLSAGFDCFSNLTAIIKPKDIVLIPLGFRIKDFGRETLHAMGDEWTSLTELMRKSGSIPYLELHLRSSLRVKGFSSGGVGIIDMDYRDEVKLVLVNQGFEELRLCKGDRIAQIIATQTPVHCMRDLETLGVGRTGGFGSTGE